MTNNKEKITLLDDIAFVINRGKPLVHSFLDVQRTTVPRGELEHYAAALQAVLQTEKYKSPNRDHFNLVEVMEKKYPQLKNTFRAWYYDTYIRC